MPADFIPQSYKNLRDWLKKQASIATVAPALGMSAAEQAAYLAQVNAVLPTVTSIVDLMEQMDQKVADLTPLLETNLPLIRKDIRRAKTAPGYLPSIGEQFNWIGDSTERDPATGRPTIEVEAQRGRVAITGKKPGYEAVNIYSRKKGADTWKLTAIRKRKFPYFDETPLATPGTPEVREYIAIGVIDDEEIGQPSETKEVVFAG